MQQPFAGSLPSRVAFDQNAHITDKSPHPDQSPFGCLLSSRRRDFELLWARQYACAVRSSSRIRLVLRRRQQCIHADVGCKTPEKRRQQLASRTDELLKENGKAHHG